MSSKEEETLERRRKAGNVRDEEGGLTMKEEITNCVE